VIRAPRNGGARHLVINRAATGARSVMLRRRERGCEGPTLGVYALLDRVVHGLPDRDR